MNNYRNTTEAALILVSFERSSTCLRTTRPILKWVYMGDNTSSHATRWAYFTRMQELVKVVLDEYNALICEQYISTKGNTPDDSSDRGGLCVDESFILRCKTSIITKNDQDTT